MTTFTVTGRPPHGLRGVLRVPGDKSISHRALLIAALAEGTSELRGVSDGDDVRRTLAAVEALGVEVAERWAGDRLSELRVSGGPFRLRPAPGPIDVGNSGTGIRLLAGLCAGLPWTTVLDGDESVRRRPMERVAEPLRSMGARIDGDRAPLRIAGGELRGIDYTPPVASAQVKSAILLAGLSAQGETVVRERLRTRAHTEELLAHCGADISVEDDAHTVRVRACTLNPLVLDVPGDPSQAAFWVVAACITPGSDLTIENLYIGPARTNFLDVLARMGADLEVDEAEGRVRARFRSLRGTEVGGEEVPGLIDEIPVLAVAAAVADGITVFRDSADLRVKETDRIATVTSELRALGAQVEPRSDGLVVAGGARLRGGLVRSHGDHRVAMAMAVAGLAADGTTSIDDWEAVATSYPKFEEDLCQCVS